MIANLIFDPRLMAGQISFAEGGASLLEYLSRTLDQSAFCDLTLVGSQRDGSATVWSPISFKTDSLTV